MLQPIILRAIREVAPQQLIENVATIDQIRDEAVAARRLNAMSLGADGRRVRRMVLGEGGVMIAVGVVIGLTGALFTARLLRGLLFGVTPHDPTTLTAVAFVLAAVGIAACWVPAARAARVDPAVALRAE